MSDYSPHTYARLIHMAAKSHGVECEVVAEPQHIRVVYSIYYAGELESRTAQIPFGKAADVLAYLAWNDTPKTIFSRYVPIQPTQLNIEQVAQ